MVDLRTVALFVCASVAMLKRFVPIEGVCSDLPSKLTLDLQLYTRPGLYLPTAGAHAVGQLNVNVQAKRAG